jgi:hypothetical protein
LDVLQSDDAAALTPTFCDPWAVIRGETVARTSKLGIALREMGDGAGSLEAFRLAVAGDPGAPEAHYHLTHALLACNGVAGWLGGNRPRRPLSPNLTYTQRGITDAHIRYSVWHHRLV